MHCVLQSSELFAYLSRDYFKRYLVSIFELYAFDIDLKFDAVEQVLTTLSLLQLKSDNFWIYDNLSSPQKLHE